MKLIYAIVHFLDKNLGSVVLSQKMLENDEMLSNYVEKIVRKIEKSDYSELPIEESTNLKLLKNFEFDPINISSDLTTDYFNVIESFNKILSGDLLFFLLEQENQEKIIGMVKLDYSTKYSHVVDYEDNVLINKIIQNKAILPSPSQSIHEGILIKKDKCLIMEKKYTDMNGEWTMSENFLKVNKTLSSIKDNVKIITRTVEKISGKYNTDNVLTQSITQTALYESIEMDSTIDGEYIAEKVFEDNPLAQSEFIQEINKQGVQNVIDVPNTNFYEKKFRKQKLKIGNGIELTIPVELLKDKEFIEFTTENDGTTSVILRNIDGLTNNLFK